MTRFAIGALFARKLRTALTALAIVLGVAMVSGTFILTDSIDNAFGTLFTDIRAGSNAVISGKAAFDLSEGSGVTAPAFDESLLAKVRGLPEVAQAEGSVDSDATQLIGKDGKAIVYGGAPNLGFSVAQGDSPFNPLMLVAGSWPRDGEVAIDQSTARKEGFEVGDVIGVQADGPVQRLKISGVARFRSDLSLGGATLAGFSLPDAQRLFDRVGKLDEIAVAAKPGVSDQQLASEIQKILPPGTQVRTGQAQAAEDASGTNDFISFLRTFLLAFGGVALFVGAFVIANSLSITIAQRMREFATLRTLGASRRQVLTSVVLEALVIGVIASIAGLFLGLGLAAGLFGLFDAVGFTLPNSGLTFELRTVWLSLAVGVLVTLLASVYPALRATTVPAIAAVREGAVLPSEPLDAIRGLAQAIVVSSVGAIVAATAIVTRPWTTLFAVVLAVLGLFLTLFGSALFPSRVAGASASITLGIAATAYGLFGNDLGTTQVLLWIGIGVLLVFAGVARLTTRLVPGMSTALSPVARWAVFVLMIVAFPIWFPIWGVYWIYRYAAFTSGWNGRRVLALVVLILTFNPIGAIVLIMWLRRKAWGWEPEWPVQFPRLLPEKESTSLGGENSRRNPQRTSSTASALMIGLALVTLVAVLASGIIQTFKGAVNDLWRDADYAITAQNNFSPIPVAAADAIVTTPGVTRVANVRTGEVAAFGKSIFATAVNPEGSTMFSLDWKDGSSTVLAGLGDDGAFVDDGYAKDHKLRVGSSVALTFPDGRERTFIVKGIFDPPTGGSPFGRVTISRAAWDKAVAAPRNLYSFVLMDGGQTAANEAKLEKTLEAFPNAKAQTRQQFIDNQIAPLSSVLNILYVLLALSVVISLFGIINTLVLTVFERTREIGMLRAIGMTRRQVRRMIRHESVITALIGAVIGMILGVALAALLVARVDFIDFNLPILQLVVFSVVAIVVGIVAAIFPARRAARLNPLEALQYE